MSPGTGGRASPRGSLLRRMRDFLKSPSFRRKDVSDSQQLPGEGGTGGFGWSRQRSPRKPATGNIRSMLQSLRGSMRRGSAVAVQEGGI